MIDHRNQAGGGESPEQEPRKRGRSLTEGQSGVWVNPRGNGDLKAGFEFRKWWLRLTGLGTG